MSADGLRSADELIVSATIGVVLEVHMGVDNSSNFGLCKVAVTVVERMADVDTICVV